ncbi:MAG: multiheme c-type cytochrome [Planctomycetota bacterium]
MNQRQRIQIVDLGALGDIDLPRGHRSWIRCGGWSLIGIGILLALGCDEVSRPLAWRSRPAVAPQPMDDRTALQDQQPGPTVASAELSLPVRPSEPAPELDRTDLRLGAFGLDALTRQDPIEPPVLAAIEGQSRQTISFRLTDAGLERSPSAQTFSPTTSVGVPSVAKSSTVTFVAAKADQDQADEESKSDQANTGVGDSDGSDAGAADDQQDPASPSDGSVKVELVPTPSAEPVVKAEMIPTPVGEPTRKPTVAKAEGTDTVPNRLRDESVSTATDDLRGDASAAEPVPEVAMGASVKAPEPGKAGTHVEAGDAKGEPASYESWETPALTLVITGQQNGYIEPCGCTGLERQKGGMARRFTFIKQLRDRGWKLFPIDAGNQVRRFGRQSEIKFHRTLEALKEMKYVSVGFGPDDLRLALEPLLEEAYEEKPGEGVYASANVVLYDSSFMPSYRMIREGDYSVAVTSILDPKKLETAPGDDMQVNDPVQSAKDVLTKIAPENPDFKVLTYFGSEEAGQQLMREVPGFDLIVVAGGYGEPTFQAMEIEGSPCKMILPGNKGMYAGLVALSPGEPLKYARVPLTHEFKDAPEMRRLMADYQEQLKDVGLSGLGLSPIPHPSGRKFAGTKVCGECHTSAMDVWEGSYHADATESIVEPKEERGDVARHFDPECLSCHVTGWNPQNYYPYASGYLDLKASNHLTGNGCENCHGPGAEHAAAERKNAQVAKERRDELREAMKLPLDRAREKCMECHDLDNSPDFHEEDAFEDVYWPDVEHYGLD